MKSKIFLLVCLALGLTSLNAQIPENIDEQIARAAISQLFSQPFEKVEVYKTEGLIVFTQYIRESDGSLWRNKVKIEGNRIKWGSHDGRWRESVYDEKVSYQINMSDRTITTTVTYDDGSKETKTFRQES